MVPTAMTRPADAQAATGMVFRVNTLAFFPLFGVGLAIYFGKPYIQPKAPHLQALALGEWSAHEAIRSAFKINGLFVVGLMAKPMLVILPVLLVELGDQPCAVPLSMVREIMPIDAEQVQEVGGSAIMVVRGEVLPLLPLMSHRAIAPLSNGR